MVFRDEIVQGNGWFTNDKGDIQDEKKSGT